MSQPSSTTEAIWGAWESVATMRSRNMPDEEITDRLEAIGLTPDFAAQLVDELPCFLEKTGGTGRIPGPPRVFISHSHRDRDMASYLQMVLEKNEVRTFFDQHQIVPGQELRDRLGLGLIWAEKLLLVWSQQSSLSDFVEWEWRRARFLMKEIIPYSLDQTGLPADLDGLVYVDQSDSKHGHAKLLRAVKGRSWQPDPETLFPGQWLAQMNIAGFGEAEYALELRANGQIVGSGHINESGFLGDLAGELGVGNIMGMRIPVTGTWAYDDRENVLELDITASLMGQANREKVRIHTTGQESGWSEGQTLGGLPWRLRRSN